MIRFFHDNRARKPKLQTLHARFKPFLTTVEHESEDSTQYHVQAKVQIAELANFCNESSTCIKQIFELFLSRAVKLTKNILANILTLFFVRTFYYKNVQAEINQNFKKIPRLRVG